MKKTLFILIPIVVFVIAIFVGAYLIKQPTFLFPKAQEYTVTGKWNITVNITSPMPMEMILPANFVQHSDGTVTGVVIDPDTGDERSATGRIEGNQLSINDLRETGTSPVEYEVVISFSGTVSEDSSRIDGIITGQIIKPTLMQGNISGTMLAIRTSVLPTQEPTQAPTQEPTQEPTQAPTQEPTEDPLGIGGNGDDTTPVPTATPTPGTGGSNGSTTPTPTDTSQSSGGVTATPPSLPESGVSWPTLTIGVGLLLLSVPILFLL